MTYREAFRTALDELGYSERIINDAVHDADTVFPDAKTDTEIKDGDERKVVTIFKLAADQMNSNPQFIEDIIRFRDAVIKRQ